MLSGHLLKQQSQERKLLTFDYRPEETRVAYFHDDHGELIFGGNATGATPEGAYQSLANRPEKVTDTVIGIPFGLLVDSSTVVRYRRNNPHNKITEDEIRKALEQVPPLEIDSVFEDLFNAKVDGLPTLEPVERLGEMVELNLYQVGGPKDALHQMIEKTKNLGPRPGLVPTSYAIAKLISQTSPKGALTLKIDPNSTEVSLSSNGHLVGIKAFDLGGNQKELLIPALEAVMEEMDYDEPWPETVYLCGSIQNYEEVRSSLLAYPWTKKINMMNFPKIEVFHPLSVNLTLPADVGLNALSLLG